MKKATKILVGVLIVIIISCMGACDKKDIRDIETYESPDGNCSLTFQQVGDPHWSFGPTDVRLVLKDSEQKTIDSIDTSIQDDGGNAGSGNIKSVEWRSDSVIIILQASEMEDKEVKLIFQ